MLRIPISTGGKQIHAYRYLSSEVAEKNTADVIMTDGEESGSGADSGWSGVSDNLSTNSEDPFWRPRRWPVTKTGLTLLI